MITGGAGFIGSALIRFLVQNKNLNILNIDKLTYAGNLRSLSNVESEANYHFLKADICDFKAISEAIRSFRPTTIIHLAAESHVDKSIEHADDFIKTNIMGTYTLLDISRGYWSELPGNEKQNFRFVHVSTDEVFGSLNRNDDAFTESSCYQPNSPYSATKASSDHLVRAWHHTYGFPAIITNCSNNYGPFQYPEKLIPLTVLNALEGKPIPVYGKGNQIRDWLYVDDHIDALWTIARKGRAGHTYNIGSDNECTNINLVNKICRLLDEISPKARQSSLSNNGCSYADQITFVKDRPGHDQRYAINASKLQDELNWEPKEPFESGLRKTIHWYTNNLEWVNAIRQDNEVNNKTKGSPRT